VVIVHSLAAKIDALAVVEFPTLECSECSVYFEGSEAMKDSYYCSMKPVPIGSKN
jgi:hypothetical protein